MLRTWDVLKLTQKKTLQCVHPDQQPRNLKKKLLFSYKHHIALWIALLACGVRAMLTRACRFAMENTTYMQENKTIITKRLLKNTFTTLVSFPWSQSCLED